MPEPVQLTQAPSTVFTSQYLPFDKHPLSDSCWSVQTGPDGKVYIACCVEHTGGNTVTVLRYNDETQQLDDLFDMDKVTGDLRDSGRATQCKIHYSFVPDPSNGMLYCATHLSGPPIGEDRYNPWAAWHDPVRAFRGAYLVAYDTVNDRIASTDLFIPKEGCRCLCIDTQRQVLYALSYPRDHFLVYDLKTKTLKDKGRIGSINSQCIFLDEQGRAYTFGDRGQMCRYDPQEDRLQECPIHFPHAEHQSAWRGVLYDAVKDPNSEAIYAVPWKPNPHLMRFWPSRGEFGEMEDLGPLTQDRDPRKFVGVNIDHVGGLVFGPDSHLYYVKAVWESKSQSPHKHWGERLNGILCRFNPITKTHEELGVLEDSSAPSHYVSRSAMDANGKLFMGKILVKPAGVYRVELQPEPSPTSSSTDAQTPNPAQLPPNPHHLRYWG